MIILVFASGSCSIFFLSSQLINNLKPDLCVDQGPVPGDTPIVYSCHHYSPQVCTDSALPRRLCRAPSSDGSPLMQHCYYRTTGEIYVGGIKSHKYNSNRCLVDAGAGGSPRLHECKVAKHKRFYRLWDFRQVSASGRSKQQRVNQRQGRGFLCCLRLFPERTNPEPSDQAVPGDGAGQRRLLPPCCRAVQRSDVEDAASHQCRRRTLGITARFWTDPWTF